MSLHTLWDPMNPLAPVLTIDGPSGAGRVPSAASSRAMGWHYLDSGALYRAVGVAASWADIDTSDASALVRCTFDTHVQFVEQGDAMRVMVNGTDATDELRLETTGALASAIAAIPGPSALKGAAARIQGAAGPGRRRPRHGHGDLPGCPTRSS